jgi:hypothetical protein
VFEGFSVTYKVIYNLLQWTKIRIRHPLYDVGRDSHPVALCTYINRLFPWYDRT